MRTKYGTRVETFRTKGLVDEQPEVQVITSPHGYASLTPRQAMMLAGQLSRWAYKNRNWIPRPPQ